MLLPFIQKRQHCQIAGDLLMAQFAQYVDLTKAKIAV